MRRFLPVITALAAAALATAVALAVPPAPPGAAVSGAAGPPLPLRVRELYVPFDDLNVLLENQPQRVLLSKAQYEELLAKAKQVAESHAPREALIASAEYVATAAEDRAEVTASLVISVLEDGLHVVPLDVGGVGLRAATLDGKGAAIGRADDGRLTLFVEGKGQHKLALDLVVPIQTTAARQFMNFHLPVPPATRLSLVVPGDVEVKSGAPVIRRTFDEKEGRTHLDLLPQAGDVQLVLSLNSHLKRKDRIVVARSVLVDEVTAGYERLHVTASMGILHRAVDQFRFAVPAGFEVTDVRSANLARWAMVTEAGRRILEVQLREETTDPVVLNLSAIRMAPKLDTWTLPTLEPLDVAGQVSVVCLALEDRLKAEAITTTGLVPIDTAVLEQAIPATVREAEPGAARLRPVVAYYAPQGTFSLAARIVKPPAGLRVTTSLLATLTDGGIEIHGGFALVPEEEKLFAVDFSVPAGWDVTSVTGDGAQPLAFERYPSAVVAAGAAAGNGAAGASGVAAGAARIHVRLPSGAASGTERRIEFIARTVPVAWFADWATKSVDFPVFAVAGAARDEGAIAVDARDDMTVRPESLDGLTPLDDNEKMRYGLAKSGSVLAYRYEAQPYKARVAVERTRPRLTAQTYSFFRIERDALVVHYELAYDVAGARARRLTLVLPKDTPTALSIRGLGGLAIKEYTSELVGEKDKERRRWTVLLADGRSGALRLAVDFEQRLTGDLKTLPLPVVEADGVAYQSGLVAVEGSAELAVAIDTTCRKVDIGELVAAEYQPGSRLLGVFGFLGSPPPVKAAVTREPAYALPPAVIERGELTTVMSAAGVAETAAHFRLKTKALFLEVKLPEKSSLWAASLDGQPLKPQREGDRLLVNLPAGGDARVHELLIVYETPVRGLGFWQGVNVPAPRLFLHQGGVDVADTPAPAAAEGVEVPMADLQWRLVLPPGFKVVRSEGTMETSQVRPPMLALSSIGGVLWESSGGVDVHHSALAFISGMGARAPAEATSRGPRSHKAMSTFDMFWNSNGSPSTEAQPADGSDMTSDMTEEADADRPGEKKTANERADGPAADMDKRVAPDAKATSTPPPPSVPGGPMVPLTVPVPPPVAAGTPKNLPTKGHAAGGATGMLGFGGGSSFGGTAMPSAGSTSDDSGSMHVTAGAALGKLKADFRGVTFEGISSLLIDLVASEPAVNPALNESLPLEMMEFRSLGSEPSLMLTIANEKRVRILALALALGVLVVGVALTSKSASRKAAYIVLVCLVATLIPVITGMIELVELVNGCFWAACLLVAYYLAAALVIWMVRKMRGWVATRAAAAVGPMALLVLAVGTAVLVASVLALGAPAAMAQSYPGTSGSTLTLGQLVPASASASAGPYVIELVPPPAPVKVPDDAIILPYNPDSKEGIRSADRVLMPYARYEELWNLANPDKPLTAKEPPAAWALAGASLAASLAGEEYMLVEGTIDIEVYTDEYVTVPLPLEGGVLAKADLDGKPARLSVAQPDSPVPMAANPAPSGKSGPAGQVALPPSSMVTLYILGKGRHRLDLAVRMRLEKRGGWRVTEGRLPAAPASALTLRVPEAGTEIRLGAVADRRSYETKTAGESIRTALPADGTLSIQWRPKVSEGQIDQTLTADSMAVLDVQEDSVHVAWAIKLEFRRGERDFFTIDVPQGFLVEKVEGANVRGWELRGGELPPAVALASAAAGPQELTVTLLKRAKAEESFVVSLWRPAEKGGAGEFAAPVVGVTGALRHSGVLVIRRSPLLDLRTVATSGVSPIDMPAASSNPLLGSSGPAIESPLGIRPYQAYRFAVAPFVVRLAAAPVTPKVAATVQTVLKVGLRERMLESRVLLTVEDRPLYRVRIAVPADLKIEHVQAPGAMEWALTDDAARPSQKILTIYLATGIQGACPIVIQGTLAGDAAHRAAANQKNAAAQRQAVASAMATDGGLPAAAGSASAPVEAVVAPAVASAAADAPTPAVPPMAAADAEGLDVVLVTALPRLEVLEVDRQEGDIAVQIEPAFEARTENLVNIERVLPDRFTWLAANQRAVAALALHYARADYAGTVKLLRRKPDVTCITVTNARVTDRSIEAAVLIDWTITGAGIRRVEFVLPAWMKDARISVPLLRQKTLTLVGDDLSPVTDPAKANLVRVTLELQDEVMGQLRVLVESDQLLTDGPHEAPIPTVIAIDGIGRTDRRYVAVESAGRDEVVVDKKDGLDPLTPQQKEWTAVSGLFRGGVTQAFVVTPAAQKPRLQFRTDQRKSAEKVEARIGLAETSLVLDAAGAYRAEQVYWIDNRTEQFLEVQMPEGAALWTALVAGEPVKPVLLPSSTAPGRLRIPIVKTAAGDLDYAVVLKYAGKMPPLGSLKMTVRFPIIRTVNIQPEVGQLQVYVPDGYEWFDFRPEDYGWYDLRGRLPMASDVELERGRLAYENKKGEKLIQTLSSDNPYAQTRAAANYAIVAEKQARLQKSLEVMAHDSESKAVQDEIANSNVQRERAAKALQGQEAASAVVQVDNNDLLRQQYTTQDNWRAGQSLQATIGNNFKDVDQSQVTNVGNAQNFNNGWFEANGLANAQPKAADQQKVAQERLKFNVNTADQQTLNQLEAGKPQAAQPQGQAAGQQMLQQFVNSGKGKEGAQAQQTDEMNRQAGNKSQLYQQRYNQQQGARRGENNEVGGANATLDSAAQQNAGNAAYRTRIMTLPQGATSEKLAKELAGITNVDGFPLAVTDGSVLSVSGDAVVTTNGPAEPTGLASLEVKLPWRGHVYRFTTVRGNLGLVAATASTPMIDSLWRIGGVVLLIVAVLVMRRLLRGRSISIRMQATISTAMILLGVIGMLVGVIPVYALLATIVGIVIKVRLYFVRRRLPAAA
jgi:hypothetical protein